MNMIELSLMFVSAFVVFTGLCSLNGRLQVSLFHWYPSSWLGGIESLGPRCPSWADRPEVLLAARGTGAVLPAARLRGRESHNWPSSFVRVKFISCVPATAHFNSVVQGVGVLGFWGQTYLLFGTALGASAIFSLPYARSALLAGYVTDHCNAGSGKCNCCRVFWPSFDAHTQTMFNTDGQSPLSHQLVCPSRAYSIPTAGHFVHPLDSCRNNCRCQRPASKQIVLLVVFVRP